MTQLTDYVSYADAQAHCTSDKLWELFDGTREHMNIAHECIDRHAGNERTAVILVRADGSDVQLGFRQLAQESSRFAHFLVERGIRPGDRVAVMLEPSREFYVAMFGAMKMGAIAVPLFTLFGPDGIRLRVQDCEPRMLVTHAEKAPLVPASPQLQVVVAGDDFVDSLSGYPSTYTCRTRAGSPPVSARMAARCRPLKKCSSRSAWLGLGPGGTLTRASFRPSRPWLCNWSARSSTRSGNWMAAMLGVP